MDRLRRDLLSRPPPRRPPSPPPGKSRSFRTLFCRRTTGRVSACLCRLFRRILLSPITPISSFAAARFPGGRFLFWLCCRHRRGWRAWSFRFFVFSTPCKSRRCGRFRDAVRQVCFIGKQTVSAAFRFPSGDDRPQHAPQNFAVSLARFCFAEEPFCEKCTNHHPAFLCLDGGVLPRLP